MTLRKAVAGTLVRAGFEAAEWMTDDVDVTPGYRLAGIRPGRVRLFHEGPDVAHFLDAYTGELRGAGYVVERTQPRTWLRPRLIVRRGSVPDVTPRREV